jgi:hypothetical protein
MVVLVMGIWSAQDHVFLGGSVEGSFGSSSNSAKSKNMPRTGVVVPSSPISTPTPVATKQVATVSSTPDVSPKEHSHHQDGDGHTAPNPPSSVPVSILTTANKRDEGGRDHRLAAVEQTIPTTSAVETVVETGQTSDGKSMDEEEGEVVEQVDMGRDSTNLQKGPSLFGSYYPS